MSRNINTLVPGTFIELGIGFTAYSFGSAITQDGPSCLAVYRATTTQPASYSPSTPLTGDKSS